MSTTSSALHDLELNQRPVYSIKHISHWLGLSAEERMVLITIRQHTKERTTLAGSKGWARVPDLQIAQDTGWSIKKVRGIIAGLQKKQILEKKADHSKGPGRSSRYAMHQQGCCFKK